MKKIIIFCTAQGRERAADTFFNLTSEAIKTHSKDIKISNTRWDGFRATFQNKPWIETKMIGNTIRGLHWDIAYIDNEIESVIVQNIIMPMGRGSEQV